MASQQELDRRLKEIGFEVFVEKTSICSMLGDKTKSPFAVMANVERALYDYRTCLEKEGVVVMVLDFKPVIIEQLLQEHPSAIEYLNKYYYLDKNHCFHKEHK